MVRGMGEFWGRSRTVIRRRPSSASPWFPSSAWEPTSRSSASRSWSGASPDGAPKQSLGARAWERGLQLHPIRHDIDQSGLARVISRAGISPVQGVIDITALNRIVVNVFELLPHHVVILN